MTIMPPLVIPALVDLTVDREIGPRLPGAIYQTSISAYEVLAVVRDPARAAGLLHRDAARWALIVRDVMRHDAEPVAIGDVWTTSDRLVREGADADRYRRAA
jgi:hypothetical protein